MEEARLELRIDGRSVEYMSIDAMVESPGNVRVSVNTKDPHGLAEKQTTRLKIGDGPGDLDLDGVVTATPTTDRFVWRAQL